jgi:secondary thiamine-phosphate synthase enzyme
MLARVERTQTKQDARRRLRQQLCSPVGCSARVATSGDGALSSRVRLSAAPGAPFHRVHGPRVRQPVRATMVDMVHTARRSVRTRGQGDAHDLTPVVTEIVAEARVKNGLAAVSVVGSTAGITTIEYEPGAVWDLNNALEQLAPRDADYRHHLRWGDDNGSSHVRAALVGPSVALPIVAGELAIGTWQQITLVEFDTRPRQREVVVQVMGDA